MTAAVSALLAVAAVALLMPRRMLEPNRAAGLGLGPTPWPATVAAATGSTRMVGLVVAAAGLLGAASAGPAAALLAAVGAGIAATALRAARTAGAASARRSAELEMLSALAAELRAGRHPAAALVAVQTPADAALAEALDAARATALLGGDVSASLRRSAGGSALPKLAAAWHVSEECGAPLAETAEQVAVDVRAAADLHRNAQVELTGARATGLVLAVLPCLGVGLGVAMGADPIRMLLHTPAGAVCVAAGLAFEVAGLAWVRRLTNGSRRGGE